MYTHQKHGVCGTRPRPNGVAGFNLLELLVTLSILALIMGLSVPAFLRTKEGMDLQNGGIMVSNTYELARQTASTLNRQVEVRFYLGEHGCQQLQIFVNEEETGRWVPESNMQNLPEAVCITANAEFSTVFHAGAGNTGTDEEGRSYRTLRFMADGGTDLAGEVYPTVTVINKTRAGDALPANYIVVQVDPQTGRIRVFQPT